ncbi:hypothetical protein SISSUDRAFT_89706 [Sistotremastrum suecicum HHB10207 ss-3]|uniref:Uncharacterized protein n=1 Tax=Sistotremastrum suecicum HHB10207 ss-3 TaxID=1314776 RepID=A0A166BA78_9AGAM|nr:hypothetical protein SISSUDRAFT_89706 [Sistotremastrum suecicum HHB10207 ss-3]
MLARSSCYSVCIHNRVHPHQNMNYTHLTLTRVADHRQHWLSNRTNHSLCSPGSSPNLSALLPVYVNARGRHDLSLFI